jgi:anaerobic selenocysteine-containing dehydrogenase
MWLEISAADAQSYNIAEGDLVRVESRRGKVEAKARISGVRQGVIFAPFHFANSASDDRPSAANELTITDWDPVSKQPIFKACAVRMTRIAGSNGQPAPAPLNTASAPVDEGSKR